MAALRMAAADAIGALAATVVYGFSAAGVIFSISAVTPLTSSETFIVGCSGAGATTSGAANTSGAGGGAAFCTGSSSPVDSTASGGDTTAVTAAAAPRTVTVSAAPTGCARSLLCLTGCLTSGTDGAGRRHAACRAAPKGD